MMHITKDILYFAAMNESAVDRWFIAEDACHQETYDNLTIERVQRIAQNDGKMEFVNSLAINESGVMFTMGNTLNRFIQGVQDVTGESGTNFHIWKQELGKSEISYLWRARYRTTPWRKRVSGRCH